jgi:hypothetical protein
MMGALEKNGMTPNETECPGCHPKSTLKMDLNDLANPHVIV